MMLQLCPQGVKQFGTRSGMTFFSGLIWVKTVHIAYQKETKLDVSERSEKKNSNKINPLYHMMSRLGVI